MNHTSLNPSRARLVAANILSILALSACSDGGGDSTAVVAGIVSGLSSGTSVVLQNNGGDDTTVTTDGLFAFSTPVANGAPYNVTVLVQPFGETCVVNNGSGTADGTNAIDVSVLCSLASYPIGVTVAGLTGTGLVVQNNGGDPLSIAANGSDQFSVMVESGSPYDSHGPQPADRAAMRCRRRRGNGGRSGDRCRGQLCCAA